MELVSAISKTLHNTLILKSNRKLFKRVVPLEHLFVRFEQMRRGRFEMIQNKTTYFIESCLSKSKSIRSILIFYLQQDPIDSFKA